MKPVLYDKNETQFRTFGLGEIADAYAVEVTRERNGNYTLYIKYPLDGAYAARFQNGMKIKADAGVRTKWQTFEISRVKRNSKEHIEVFAKHISHQTEHLQLRPKVKAGQQTAQMALNLWKENLVGGVSFDVWSDIDTVANVNWEIGNISSSRDALGGVDGSILDLFGGEYEFDNTLIRLHRRLGRQAPVVLEYGRNVVSIEQDDSFDEVYTSIYPFAKYTPQSEGETQADEVLVTLPELVVDGPYLANFAKRRIKLVDFSGHFQDQEVPTVEKIRSLAQAYVISNRLGLPKVDIEVDYVDLAKTLDYKEFSVMEEVELCDVIPLYYPKFGITSTEEKVVEIVYDVLNDENKTIKLGTIGKSISQQLTSSVVERVEQLENRQTSQEQVLSSYLVDGKGNKVWRERPSATLEHKIGDVWFEKNGLYERMYIWNGNQWEKILDTEDVDRVGKKVAQVQAKADQVAEQARQSDQKAQEALTAAGASRDLAQTAKSVADQARASAGQALTNLQAARTALQESITSVQTDVRNQADALANQARNQTDLTSRLTTVEETANGTKSTLTELTKTVDDNTGNLTSVTQRVATAETTLTNVRNQYSTLKTAVDDQTGKVTNLERQTADLSSGLDGVRERFENLSVGARNFIPDFGFEKSQAFNQHQSEWTFERLADATARSGWQIKATCRRAGGGGFHRLLFDLRGAEWQGKTMTYAVDVKASRPLRLRIGAEVFGKGAKVQDVTTDWQRLVQTDDVRLNRWYSFVWYIAEGSWRVGDVVYLRDPQLEEGTIATTPHPAEEDFRQEFAEYVRTATENRAELGRKVQGLDGSLSETRTLAQQTANGISQLATKTEVNAVTGRLSTAEASIKTQADQISQRLTSTEVDSLVANKGYQTKADVDKNITGRGYLTSSALAGYVPSTTFDNYKRETAQTIERQLTETRALIPTEVGGRNLIQNGAFPTVAWPGTKLTKHAFYFNNQKTLFLLETMSSSEVTAGSNRFSVKRNTDYTLSFVAFSASRVKSSDVWFLGRKDGETAGFTATNLIVSAKRFSPSKSEYVTATFNSGDNDTGYIRFDNNGSSDGQMASMFFGEVMLVEGRTAHRWSPALEDVVTSVDFNHVKETARLYERVLGQTEGDVSTNIARQVMTSQLYQTEVSKQQTDSELLSRLADGVPMTGNKHFATDLAGYNVYDNARTGHVTISRVADQLSPSGYAMMVRTSGSGTSPWLGGFRHEVTTAKNKEFLVRLVAKIPAGRKLYFHNNSLGIGASWRWLSSVDGTGSYATYVAYVKSGYEGPFSSFGFWAIGGGATPTASSPLVWYVSEYQVYDITNSRTEALTTRVTQMAGNYAIQNLNSNGDVLSALNLATGGASIQVGQNKLVITPTTTFIQNGTIKSAMIESLDAGKITAGELNAANVDIINLNVGKVKGLDGKFILAEIENGFIEWMQGKVITAKNGAMAINLDRANLTFNQNATVDFNSSNNALVRRRGTHTGFLHFIDEPKGGVYAGLGVTSSGDGVNSESSGRFAGIRIFRTAVGGTNSRQHQAALDQTEIYGDNLIVKDGFDNLRGFYFRPHLLPSNRVVDMNKMVTAVTKMAELWRHMSNSFSNPGNTDYTAMKREIDNRLSQIESF